jgi:hypothetical protein
MSNRNRRQAAVATKIASLIVLAASVGHGPLAAQDWGSRRPTGLRHLQTMVPTSGPPGTLVRIESQNLPPQYRVHVGTGAVGEGFEDAVEAEIGEWGEISVTIPIPTYASWDKPIYFVAFDGNFSPIALSDPFHVTNTAGLIRRDGRVVGRDGACLVMRDEDDYRYTLAGDIGALRTGDEITVDGTYAVAGRCAGGHTIEVVRVVASP